LDNEIDIGEFDVNDLLKRILEEEEYVKSQSLNYQEYLPEFIARAREDLELIEANALILEKDYGNKDIINDMFRSFHNIKGSSGFVGQDIIQKVAHQTETLMDGCRKGAIEVDKEIIDFILISGDYIGRICDEPEIAQDESFFEGIFLHIQNMETKSADFAGKKSKKKEKEKKEEQESALELETQLNSEFFEHFVTEAGAYIDNADCNLLLLEKNIQDVELMHIIFRDLHTLKGLAGFAGMTIIQRIMHQAESVMDECRKSTVKINKTIINLLLKAINYADQICKDINLAQNKEFLENICLLIKNLQEEKIKNKNYEENEYLEDFQVETKEHLEFIEMNVLILEKEPENEELIHSLFRAFHTIKGMSGFVELDIIGNIAHQTETIMDGCRKGHTKVTKKIIDLMLNSADYIKKICNDINLANDENFLKEVENYLKSIEKDIVNPEEEIPQEKKIGEILVEEKVIKAPEVEEILEKQKTDYPDLKFGQIVIKENKAEAKEVINAVRKQQSKATPPEADDYMRISTNKVDNLVDMVGELIITQSLVEQIASAALGTNNSFVLNFGRMARITKDLQNLAMFLRMVSLKSTFHKISRIARDTINELDKDINFTTTGDETEIDRIVTEKLLDPLVHLVKNAVSHGIEDKSERIQGGKPPQGNISVSAYNKRGNIYIEIADDGKGINIEKVYQKALEKGLIDPKKQYSEKEMQEFILLPGFSTAETVNNISGRGVGMDVVKTEILKIGGKVDIYSKVNEGSVFTLKIPVNHAVMNGTIVDIEGSNYIIPTVNVKQILQPKDEDWVYIQGIRSMIKIRDDIIPLIYISKLFKTNKEEEKPSLIVVLEMDRKFTALPVRNIIGRQEIVIKPSGEEFSHLAYVSGMSILGDGKVSLILDIEYLFEAEGAQ